MLAACTGVRRSPHLGGREERGGGVGASATEAGGDRDALVDVERDARFLGTSSGTPDQGFHGASGEVVVEPGLDRTGHLAIAPDVQRPHARGSLGQSREVVQ